MERFCGKSSKAMIEGKNTKAVRGAKGLAQ